MSMKGLGVSGVLWDSDTLQAASGWQELLRLRADIYKKRKEAKARAAKERDEMIELVITVIAIIAGVAVLTGIGAIAYTEYYR